MSGPTRRPPRNPVPPTVRDDGAGDDRYDEPTRRPAASDDADEQRYNKPTQAARKAVPPTVDVRNQKGAAPTAPRIGNKDAISQATRIYSPDDAIDGASVGSAGDAIEFIAGWLVVVEGLGRGSALGLGYGYNKIGRGGDARASIDFGDGKISRGAHCVVIYEPRERVFTLEHRDGVNPTYLNGQHVREGRTLDTGDEIEIGKTKLRFVPLCGPDWDWNDSLTEAA